VLPLAAGPGFTFGEVYPFGLLFIGVALFAAVGALSHQHERAFSASLVYLALGIAASVAIQLFDVAWIDPIRHARVIERLAEVAVVIALFATGLRLDRPLDPRRWGSVARLLGLAMPLSIAAVALLGHELVGLSVAAAIVLGAVLAPTDPVLAGDVGVGPPGEDDEREPHFALTAEAGLNDGLAFPFVLLGLFAAERGGWRWLGDWALADVLYAVAAGVGIGALLGFGIAALAVPLRDRKLLSERLDGWLPVAAVLVIYGLSEVAGGYGFLAAFAGGLAFRRYEHGHELNASVHDGAEIVEKFAELALILLLGSLLTLGGLAEPGWRGWLLVAALVLVVRPLAVLVSFVRSTVPGRERLFVAWFGVRGIGSLYYIAFVVAGGALTAERVQLFWIVAATIVVSIVLHGVTASPLTERLVEPSPDYTASADGRDAGEERGRMISSTSP